MRESQLPLKKLERICGYFVNTIFQEITDSFYHFGFVIAPSDADVTSDANFANAPFS